MRWAFSWPAVAVGVAIFGLWVGLDGLYPRIYKAGLAWNPHHQFGAGSALAWGFALTRLAGSTLVVPPLEEVFYRSFLYRYLARQDFLAVPLGAFAWLPFLATSAIFGLGHHQWLPGIICGLAFQGLVCWKKRLGDALTAHATTNFLLGWWVIGKDAWNFW
jgi:CAAX prenyl protease-like protein